MAQEAPLASDPSQDRGPGLLRFCIAFTATAGVFLLLRISVRASKRLLGWDDLAITIAMVAATLQTIFTAISISHGYGKHIGDIEPSELPRALFWFYLCQICYKCTTWPTKASILLMYQRVFGDTPDVRSYGVRFRTLVRAMLAVVAASFISTSIVGIFACHPIRYAWNRSIEGSCVPTIPWWFSYAAINICTDIIILALPVPLISGLMRITKRQKIVLMGVFLLGAFVCIVTIIRMTTLRTGARGHDPTYTGVETLEWTGIETNVGIICACLPLLRPVLNALIPWFAQRTRRSSHSRPTYAYGYGGSNPTKSQRTADDHTWSNVGNRQNVIMNHISAQRSDSRGSSQDGITDGIIVTKKIDYSESAEDYESEKDRQLSHAISMDVV